MLLFLKDFIKNLAYLGCVCSLLMSCHTIKPTHETAGEQIVNAMQDGISADKRLAQGKTHTVPRGVHSSLLPPLSHYVQPVKNSESHFDVSANKLPAKEFFMSLVAGTNHNMVVHPNITGTISLDLKNVTIKQAMDAVRDTYGYEYRKTSYGYEVLPPHLETRLFHINYLDVQRTGKSYIELNTGQVSSIGTINIGSGSYNNNMPNTQQLAPGTASPSTISSIETKSEMQFWKSIHASIENMIGKEPGHSVTVNAQAGVISVRAYPNELKTIYRFINSLQASLNRQVILEAKILEVQLEDEYQAGIDWSILGNPALADASGNPVTNDAGIGQGGTNAFEDTDLKKLTQGIFALRVKGNFKTLIEVLQTQGNVQVLSSPHISTVNNQKAVIKVGQDEFFVTGVSTSNTIVGTNTIPSQDVSLTPFFSGITLDVTPEISSDDTIVLHIHPSVSRVTEQTKVIGLGSTSDGSANNLTLPLAKSQIRESDNIVRAKDGQVVIIGGLMQNTMTETIAGTPGISKVPFLGALFRRTDQVAKKSELVILLKPVVATNKNITKTMEGQKKTFEQLRRPFHAGGLPKVFGNEAERDDNE